MQKNSSSKSSTKGAKIKDKSDKLSTGDYSINPDELYLVGDAELEEKGLVHHHLSSINDLYTNGIPHIITQVFKVEKDILNTRNITAEDKEIEYIHVEGKFTNVYIGRPTTTHYFSGKDEILFPNSAVISDKTLSADLRIDMQITATAYLKNKDTKVRTDEVKNFKLCKIPVMVGSKLCHTYKATKEILIRNNEDPLDPGGYFVIKGVEWVIDCVENILYNQIRIFKNEGYNKESIRGEIISKPGDAYQNSDQFLLRYMVDGQLNCEIARDRLKNVQIPFYLLFRLLGWSSDKEMIDNITYGTESEVGKHIMKYVINSLGVKYNDIPNGRYVYSQADVLKLIIDRII